MARIVVVIPSEAPVFREWVLSETVSVHPISQSSTDRLVWYKPTDIGEGSQRTVRIRTEYGCIDAGVVGLDYCEIFRVSCRIRIRILHAQFVVTSTLGSDSIKIFRRYAVRGEAKIICRNDGSH